MDDIKKMQQGTLKVSEDVILTIVNLAVNETDGIEGLVPLTDNMGGVIFKKKELKNIKIKNLADSIEIEIMVIAKYGCKVSSVGEKLQERIKNDVQSMTGIRVSKVSVVFTDIAFDKAEEKTE